MPMEYVREVRIKIYTSFLSGDMVVLSPSLFLSELIFSKYF
jgi:hypothetical protein